MSDQGDPPWAAGLHPGASPLRAAAFAASFGRKPYGAATAAHGTPGDWPPAVPAVSRCRARQHHGQAVTLTPGAPVAVKMSQLPGRNAAHCPGLTARARLEARPEAHAANLP